MLGSACTAQAMAFAPATLRMQIRQPQISNVISSQHCVYGEQTSICQNMLCMKATDFASQSFALEHSF